METLNAQIIGTRLGLHGDILTFNIDLDIQGGFGCSLGGYAMAMFKGDNIEERPKSTSMIMRILDVVGVDSWEELKGQYVRVNAKHLDDKVTAIGNIMNDEWIDFDTFGKEDNM